MKEKYQQRLRLDFEKYVKQIGITDEEIPQLITDRKTMDEIRSKWPDGGRGRSTKRNYGICYREEKIIFVNQNSRKADYRQYKGARYSQHYISKHKMTYRDYLHTMIHELVHYRFKSLPHGKEYEKRIRNILHGKVWPKKVLFEPDSTPQTENKSITAVNYENLYVELLAKYQALISDLRRIGNELLSIQYQPT